ncbi:PucR family transcriptional regulator [Nocardioides donggukensis]|uniref:Helix-turn-helix domain-containing protein n=1 Tax=Nocardioides donggukensis TaxID=2774019 RepID=A0A927PZZ7_9ACTN|nr:PucR family transcriptional regulator [Nocardioides donggukensis]MBD8868277.1 helix-turn-helix domain-containing protein [Nocardioides donggukensis]
MDAPVGSTPLGGFLARHRRERVDALTDGLVGRIQATAPDYLDLDRVPTADLRASCHDNIVRVLELLGLEVARDEAAGGDAAAGAGLVAAPGDPLDGLYDAARETGRRRAEQGMPLDAVLRSFRFGGRIIWEDLVDEAADSLDPADLRVLGTGLWQVVDETSAQVAAAYHATERLHVQEDEQRRAELWEGLLGGRAADPAFAEEAGRILDLPVSGRYLVVAVAGHLPGDPAMSHRTAAGAVTRWVRRTPGTVGLVSLGRARMEAVTAALGRIASLPIGHSGEATGLAGVEPAFRQALLALRSCGGRAGVATFDERLPEALLLGSPDVAGRLLDIWLGGVLALPDAESRPLLETLEHWVATGGSTTRTASRTHCHRNTVINRLRRVAELTGRDLSEAAPPLELALALRVLRVAPPS